MTETNPREHNLRLAWSKASGDSFAHRLARKSLEASALQDPGLASTLSDIQSESQSENYQYETHKENNAYSDGCSYGYSEGLKDGIQLERERIIKVFQTKEANKPIIEEEVRALYLSENWEIYTADELEATIREAQDY